jgi:hypothetical protein
MQELDSGTVKPVAWVEARQQISAILNGRSADRMGQSKSESPP